MRDRLSSLRSLSWTNDHHEEEEEDEDIQVESTRGSFSQLSFGEDEEEEEEEQQVALEKPGKEHGEVEEVLAEAQEVRKDIQMLRLDVKRLREQNTRLLSDPCSSKELRQDSAAISDGIKGRSQDTLARLHKMDANARELEEQRGVNSAVARIARSQYAVLSNGFRDAIMDYNEAEMNHRETCKRHIQRQMEIVGREVDLEEVDSMFEDGQWNVFTQSLQSEGRTARSALCQIECRHQELLDLERRIKGIQEVFIDVAMLVEEQGALANSINVTVEKAEVYTSDALVKIQTAKKHDRNNPLKKLFFWRR